MEDHALDTDRIRAIVTAEHSYYGTHRAVIRHDARLTFGPGDFVMSHVTPTMRVLDIGCGNGADLLEHSRDFGAGVGLDNDRAHLRLAEEEKRRQGVANVDFLLLDFPAELGREPETLAPASFDVVFSKRGIDPTLESFGAAVRLLRPDGLFFVEEIGDRHLRGVEAVFGSRPDADHVTRTEEAVRDVMAQSGVDVRLAADLVSKWCYPDIYEWLLWQCSVWTWLGVPLPEPDDPRIAQFAASAANARGEIETTHHVVVVGGVKR